MEEASALEKIFEGHNDLLKRLTLAFSSDESLTAKLNEAAEKALGRMENREDDFYTDPYECAGMYVEAVRDIDVVRGTGHEEGLWKVLGNYLGAYELLKEYMKLMGASDEFVKTFKDKHEGRHSDFARGNVYYIYGDISHHSSSSHYGGLVRAIGAEFSKKKPGLRWDLCEPMITLLAEKRRDELLDFFKPLIPDRSDKKLYKEDVKEFLSNISMAINRLQE